MIVQLHLAADKGCEGVQAAIGRCGKFATL